MSTYLNKIFRFVFLGLFILLIYFFCVGFISQNNFKNDLFYVFDESVFNSVCCVSSRRSDNIPLSNNSALKFEKVINSANKEFLYLDKNFKFNKRSYNEILKYDYIEMICKNKERVKLIIEKYKAKLIFIESIKDKTICYYNLPILQKFKLFKGYKINLQIVWQLDACLIGYPMVYTSF